MGEIPVGHFLDVAHEILSEVGHPLSAKELTEMGLEKRILKTRGETPYQTMKSKLSTDILAKRSRSAFMRTEKGLFGLRIWKSEMGKSEFVAARFKKALLDEDAVVFPAASLPKYIKRPGLHIGVLGNSRELLNECRPMLRRKAEEDFSVVQLVSVFILRFGSRYLTYKRTKRLPESRLHHVYSMFFGGHLTPEDAITLFNIFQPKDGEALLIRELSEEVRFAENEFPTPIYKGFLYDPSRDVSSQHLGIVFDVFLKTDKYEIGERGFLMDPKFESLDEIEDRTGDFENWSVLIARHERQIVG